MIIRTAGMLEIFKILCNFSGQIYRAKGEPLVTCDYRWDFYVFPQCFCAELGLEKYPKIGAELSEKFQIKIFSGCPDFYFQKFFLPAANRNLTYFYNRP